MTLILPSSSSPMTHVFALSMPAAQAETLRDPARLADALGTDLARPDQAEIVATGDLDALGLTAYLVEGFGVTPDSARDNRTRLDALSGHVLVLRSAAFGGETPTLSPDAALTLIASLPEDTAPPPAMAPLRSEGAKGVITGGQGEVTPHAASRRTLILGVLTVMVLALVVFALVRFP